MFSFCSFHNSMPPSPPIAAMKPRTDLRALRERIRARERHAAHAWPLLSLGSPKLDDALAGQELATGALHEFAPASYGDFSATAGFCFSLLARALRIRRGFVLYAAPTFHLFREGAPFPPGFMAFGCSPDQFIEARARKSEDVLWAMEEGLENAAIAAVVGVLPENDRAYDFTASRRLAMRASEHGATAFLLRGGQDVELATAADTRWRVAAAPSAPRSWPGRRTPGLGNPQWRVELTKARRGAPGVWRIVWDDETFSFRLASPLADRKTVPAHGGDLGERRVGAL